MTKSLNKGSVLLLVLLIISVLLLSGAALMAKVISAGKITGIGLHRVRALYIAEAGIGRARWRLGLENDLTNVPPANNLYTDEAFGDGAYTVILSERNATEATITSAGKYGSATRTVSIRIRLSAQWWDPAWRYRRPVTISNNTPSDLTDYQVRVVVPYEAGKMNADYSDLRFLDENDNELSYWIEAGDASSAVIWVKVLQITGGTDTVITAYYGNPGAPAASDITTTMEPEYIKYDIPATWTSRTSVTSIASGNNVGSWVDIPFTFPYYQVSETRVYACSNGYLSFGNDYNNDRRNRSNKLRARRMIAPLWDDLRTDTIYDICDEPGIYVDSYTDNILIDWEAYRSGFAFLNAAALFQVTLYRNGDILLSRGDTTNDFLIGETAGVSKGAGGVYIETTSESQPNRSWLFAMRNYVTPEPTVGLGDEETLSPTIILYWKEE
jgi:hypothetical protein